MRRRDWLVVALVVSVAFNLGFVVGWALDRQHTDTREALPGPDVATYPAEFQTLCTRLQGDLADLRMEQAEATRDLAEKMTCAHPDRAAIDRCLDRLATADRKARAAVVSTILSQREVLPQSQRQTFCDHVQKRLCEPFADCNSPAGCPSREDAGDDNAQPEPKPQGGIHDS